MAEWKEAGGGLGRFAKFSSPASLAVCLPEAGAGACGPPRRRVHAGQFWGRSPRGPGGRLGPGEGVSKTTLRGAYTWGGGQKGLDREVTWNQLNSCACLVWTLETSPRCSFARGAPDDKAATG